MMKVTFLLFSLFQLARSESSGGVAEGCRAQTRGPQTDSSSAGRSRVSSRPQVKVGAIGLASTHTTSPSRPLLLHR